MDTTQFSAKNCDLWRGPLPLCHQLGVPIIRAEIIPIEPDADNAAEGRQG
mgnify:CR=1 FL=1